MSKKIALGFVGLGGLLLLLTGSKKTKAAPLGNSLIGDIDYSDADGSFTAPVVPASFAPVTEKVTPAPGMVKPALPAEIAQTPAQVAPEKVAPAPVMVEPEKVAPAPVMVAPEKVAPAPAPTMVKPSLPIEIAKPTAQISPPDISPAPVMVAPEKVAPAPVMVAPEIVAPAPVMVAPEQVAPAPQKITVEDEAGNLLAVESDEEASPLEEAEAKIEVEKPTILADDTRKVLDELLPAEKRSDWKRKSPVLMTWQEARGLKPDGMFGPRSATKMAEETGLLPIVRFWPKASIPGRAEIALKNIYLEAAENAEPPRKAQLQAAAEREKGQGFGRPQTPILTLIEL